MPYIPHTEADIAEMLQVIGVARLEDLFEEIPSTLRVAEPLELPAAGSEMEVARLMRERASQDGRPLCFLGAGAYEHHIPAPVWELATRGEYYSAYTPYQAEASQGTLQLLYEYQSMMTALTGLDVSNASLYDGASALGEAVLMAVRANRRSQSRRVLMPASVHPVYRRVVHTLVRQQGIELVELAYDTASGAVDTAALEAHAEEDCAALVIPQPNFFGIWEEVDALTDWAHAQGALAIGLVNPVALALVRPPGEWGEAGADIAVGEGQPLGIPLSSGGPYFGFLCCQRALMRQMPGRIVGRTVDAEGKLGFTLTLQAREQHIRRSKATSNICTNQGLMVTAATIHMALLGAEGLARVASRALQNTRALVARLTEIPGVSKVFQGTHFHEAVLRLEASVSSVLRALGAQSILGGYALGRSYPELEGCLLVCATETKSAADLERYASHLERIMAKQQPVQCPIQPRW